MRRTKSIGLLISISLLLMAFTSCRSTNEKEELDLNNLFEYGISITNNVFSPGQVDFYMTVDEVLQAKSLDYSAVSEDDISSKKIINNVNVTDLSHEMTEVYNFYEGQLMSVRYIILASDSEQEKIRNILYEQAKEQMPAPTTDNLEDIKEGNTTIQWWDEKQNRIDISFPITNDDELNAIILGICVLKNNI